MAVLDAIARIDVARAKKVGEMLITAGEGMTEPERVLIDVAKLSAVEMLRAYREKRSRYATAPFDVNGDFLRFYPGGVSIWSGYPGTGKTTLLRQFACQLLHNKNQVFFASLEEDPSDLIVRCAGVAFGQEEPTDQQLQWFIDYYANDFRVWGKIGIAKHAEIIGIIQHLAKQGMTHAIIDSMMCLDIPNDDFEKQRQFANLLGNVARTLGIHIHLVAHPRKIVSSDQEPDLNDVAGAREIGGIADNVLFIRRGKEPAFDDSIIGMGVVIRKQRHGSGYLGTVAGWFNRKLKQFKRDQFETFPTQYLPREAYEKTEQQA